MRQLILLASLWLVGAITPCTKAQVLREEFNPKQMSFLGELEGEWKIAKVFVNGSEFKEKVSIRSVVVNQDEFIFNAVDDTKVRFRYVKILDEEKKLELSTIVDDKPVRYLMRIEGEKMWLCTKGNRNDTTELKDIPNRDNMCILLERPPEK